MLRLGMVIYETLHAISPYSIQNMDIGVLSPLKILVCYDPPATEVL